MENNEVEEIVISKEVFDEDFDNAGWEPEVIADDSDEDMANTFDY